MDEQPFTSAMPTMYAMAGDQGMGKGNTANKLDYILNWAKKA